MNKNQDLKGDDRKTIISIIVTGCLTVAMLIVLASLLTGCSVRLPPPPTDTICELDIILLDAPEWDTLSEQSVDQIYNTNEQICAACPDKC